MNQLTGQIVRFVGLLIEMLGILALVFRTGTDQAGIPLPGSFPIRLVWGVVGVGFVLWLAGTVMIYWLRPTNSRLDSKVSEIDKLNL